MSLLFREKNNGSAYGPGTYFIQADENVVAAEFSVTCSY
jgi:hypothetical protein